MRQTTYVADIDDDHVLLISERASSCGGCAGKASCSTLGSWKEGSGKGKILSLRVKNTLAARIGDEVILEVPDGLLLKVAFRLYAIPMILFVLIGAMVWFQSASDLLASLAGIAAVILYYASIWRQKSQESFDAVMVAVKEAP